MQFIKQSQFRRLFLVLLLLFVGGAVWSSVQVIKLSKEVESLQSQVLSLEKQVGNAQDAIRDAYETIKKFILFSCKERGYESRVKIIFSKVLKKV